MNAHKQVEQLLTPGHEDETSIEACFQLLGPDYARTAYSTQGLTLDAALVDLCFSDETNPTTAYVALSRVRGANDVLIIQEFDIAPFQQGVPVGPKWLLKTL